MHQSASYNVQVQRCCGFGCKLNSHRPARAQWTLLNDLPTALFLSPIETTPYFFGGNWKGVEHVDFRQDGSFIAPATPRFSKLHPAHVNNECGMDKLMP